MELDNCPFRLNLEFEQAVRIYDTIYFFVVESYYKKRYKIVNSKAQFLPLMFTISA